MNCRFKNHILIMLLTILFALYLLILSMDLFNMKFFIDSDTIKYISVVLCFFTALMTIHNALDPLDIFLLCTGLFFTTISDLCLLILNYNMLGVSIFCMVQITYCTRYYRGKIKNTLINFVIILLVLFLLFFTFKIFDKTADILLEVGIFYAICLGTSVYRGVRACTHKLFPSPNKYLIAYGMVLFLLCDVNVALYNASKFMDLSSSAVNHLNSISGSIIWLFYLPSQVFLSISGFNFKKTFAKNLS